VTAGEVHAVEFEETKIDEVFAELNQCRLPGCAVGIAIHGTPVYRKGFGLASMELPVVLAPTMRMRIGSTTKHFTCLAYLLLCEEGRAGIDDPIVKYLPELHPVTHPIAMRQLMGNISGLREVYDLCHQFNGAARVTSTELVSLYQCIDDVNSVPGALWIYNNGGWAILSKVIERITGTSLEDFLRVQIFEPTGMHDTLLRRWDSDFVANSATLHMKNAAGQYLRQAWMDYAGAGAMVSTIDDMLKWLAHMDAPIVGRAETWRLLKETQILANGTPTNYGLGLFLTRYRGIKTIHHPGSWLGGNAQMIKIPSVGLDVVVMVNRHDVSAITLVNRVINACLPYLDAVQRPKSTSILSGVFHSPQTGRVVQLFGRTGQQYVSICGADFPVEIDAHGSLRPSSPMEFFAWAVTVAGNISPIAAIDLIEFGHTDRLLAAIAPRPSQKPLIVGRYRSESTGTEFTISDSSKGFALSATGKFGTASYDLVQLSGTIWRATSPNAVIPPGGVLTFDAAATSLSFSTSQNWALPFRRCA
jgi:D-aminopeptidase